MNGITLLKVDSTSMSGLLKLSKTLSKIFVFELVQNYLDSLFNAFDDIFDIFKKVRDALGW